MAEGLPLVFVHAFPMGPGMWRSQIDAITDRRVLAPALPAFDGHPRLPEPTIDGYARDLLNTLDAEQIDRAVFCGLSLGGYVLFGILRQAPERVAGLILADTRTSVDTPERLAARVRSIETARRGGSSAIADEMIPALLGKTTQASQPSVAASVRALIEAQSAEAIVDGLQAMMTRPDSAGVLAAVRVPTLIVVGSEDTITPLGDAEHMHRAIAGSRLITIPAAGHMSNMEAPGEFNEAVAEFLGSAQFEA